MRGCIRDDGIVILMNFPQRPDGPAIYDGKSYSAAVHLAEDVKPFVAIDNGLRARGFSAPAIHHADLDAGFLITEDFGSDGRDRRRSARARSPSVMRPRPTCWPRCIGKTLPETLPLAPHQPTRFPPSTPTRC